MLKKDREIKDENEILDIIRRADECYLAMSFKDKPYVIPVNFGYEDNTVYIHCAHQGMKIDILKQNPQVSLTFAVDIETRLYGPPDTWTTHYRSVVAFGKASLISDLKERQKGLNVFLKHYAGKEMDFEDKDLEKVNIIKIEIESMTGKGNIAE